MLTYTRWLIYKWRTFGIRTDVRISDNVFDSLSG